jgi:hypothetical protein
VQAGLSPDIGARSISEAAAQVVTRAGCRLAQTSVPGGGMQTGVTRTDRQGIGQQCPERGAIYRSLYIQARGVLKKELLTHLRAKRTVRRSQHASLKRNGNGQIKDAVSIGERPASVEDRAVPGHHCLSGMDGMPERGEGDLIGGSKNSYIATLVERHSRYVMLVKVTNKDTESVVTALIKSAQKLPRELYKSLTWDRGKELADHPRFTLATDVDVYFCDPQSPLSADCYAIACRALRGNAAQMKIPTGF